MWRYRRTIIGIGLIALVLVFIYIRDTRNQTSELPLPQGQIFPSFNETQLREVRLIDPNAVDSPLVMTQSPDGTWTIVGESRELDPLQVDVLLALLANITFLEQFEVSEDDFGGYGLEGEGQFVAEFTTDTQITNRLIVGNLGDKERTYAVRVNQSAQVFVIDRVPIDFFKITYDQPPFLE